MTVYRRLRRQGDAYLLALAGVIVAAALRYEMGAILGGAIPVVIFTVPVLLASLYGGFGPGMFCTIASAAVSSYLFIAPYSLVLPVQASVILLTFVAIGTTISYFGQRMKTLQASLVSQAMKLEAANHELAHADRSKDEFLAMLAHELRNPLAGISTAAELIKLSPSDPHRIGQIGGMISRQVRHMNKLVDDLLDVSRVTRGLVVIDKEPVDLKATLQGAIEQVQAAFAAKRQALTVRVPEQPAWVHGDRTRLTQVISNLLANASRYSPPDSAIDVGIAVAPGEVEIVVSDSGQGIDSALLPRIFELFVQAERSIDRAQGGLGIGLALVRRIVEMHGGSVTASSEGANRGSRFVVTLPRIAHAASSAAATTGKADAVAFGTGQKILVVDDNRDAADAIASLLDARGHTVFVAYDVAQARACARREMLDVLILDIGLPEQDGRALCREMKTIPHLGNALFIALSGYGQQSDLALSREAGFDHHFTKPARLDELFGVLRAHESAG